MEVKNLIKRNVKFNPSVYALEILKAEHFTTNCRSFFWRKIENMIGQNKKGALSEFLFEASPSQVS